MDEENSENSDEEAPEAPEEAEAPEEPEEAEAVDPDSLSVLDYLTRRYQLERRFTVGLPNEAGELREASDQALTYTDGMSFAIALLLDAEDEEDEGFDLTQEALIEIGKLCLRYTGPMNGTRLPVGFELVELRDGPPSEADKARLKALSKSVPGLSKVSIRCYWADRQSGEVWGSTLVGSLDTSRRFLERALKEPRSLAPPVQAAPIPERKPIATFALLGVLTLCFLGELAFGVRPAEGFMNPHITTLVSLGGMFRPLVDDEGELWRFFTPAFLHGDQWHLLFNGVALVMAGWVIEKVFGRAWFLALFAIGAVGGSLASYLFNAPNLVSVGASGAIMALFSAALVATMRMPEGSDRTQIQMQLARVLIPSLLPIMSTAEGGQIDIAAHIGGAVVGAVAGYGLYATWSKEAVDPPGQRAAYAVFGLYALGLCWGLGGVVGSYDQNQAEANAPNFIELLIPNEDLPVGNDQERAATMMANLDRYLRDYPRDPRTQYFAGLRAYDAGEVGRAEAYFRAALGEEEILEAHFPSGQLRDGIRAMLISCLLDQGRRGEAVEAARPLCSSRTPGNEEFLSHWRLCEGASASPPAP